MKCPICNEETMGWDTQQWGPEFAHTRCVVAYNHGMSDARAAVEAALRAPQQAEGWVMVPVEPTREMIDAYLKGTASGFYSARSDWANMLAARPSAPTAVEPDERDCEWTNCPHRVGNVCCNPPTTTEQAT